jgi:predicted RNase H-related nuclease YkuK (DUF458 family)
MLCVWILAPARTEVPNKSVGTPQLDLGTDTAVADECIKVDNVDTNNLKSEACVSDALPVSDDTAIVEGSADPTKEVFIEADGLTSGTSRTITMPDEDVDLGGLTDSNIASDAIGADELKDSNAPSDEECYTYESTGTTGEWQPCTTQSIVVSVSDTTSAITTGTDKESFRLPTAFEVSSVRASLRTSSSSGVVTVDINEDGTSILSTLLTIDALEETSTSAATAAVVSDTTLADDAEISFDIDTAGTNAVGLKVTIIGVVP